MTTERAAQLRIHCTCGQKMRVTQDMYGRPGKCVKCRQKLRIPRRDEIPPGTDEIYLRKHPEFLRKVKARHRDKDEVELQAEENGEGAQWDAPIDGLGPLQRLCSLDLKVKRQLEALDNAEDPKGTDPKRAVLLEHQARAQAARAELDEEVRQRLMEVAVELASMRDKFDQINLAVRVGEVGFAEFRTQMARLRRRRDSLERRQANLRAWLSVRDPYTAGGYIDAPLEDVPRSPFRIALAPEIGEEQALPDVHVEELRRALARRELADNKLGQAHRAERENENESPLADPHEACRGERRRASAAVGYCRRRLEQLRGDYAEDVRALDSALNLARGRMQVGEIKRAQYDKAERAILQAKTDLSKAINLISRALSANTAQDVPHPGGTYLARLAQVGTSASVPLDAWLVWSASLALVACLFLPALGGLSPLKVFQRFGSETGSVHWIVSGPVLTALLLAGAACVPRQGLRGLLVGSVAVCACVAGVAFCHEIGYDLGRLGELAREGRHWLLQPAVLLFSASLLVAMSTSSLALLPVRGAWLAIPALGVLGLMGVAGVLTDAAGALAPSPSVTIAVDEPMETDELGEHVSITVSNSGRRTMLLSSNPKADTTPARKPNTYVIAVQRRAGEEGWEELVLPREVRVGDLRRRPSLADLPDLPVAGGQNAVLNFRLTPGSYRVLLDGKLVDEFEVAASEQSSSTPFEEEKRAEENAEAHGDDGSGSASGDLPRGIQAELRGIVVAPGREPRFSIDVYVPRETPLQRSLMIGGVVYGAWEIKAYDPEGQAITLTDGEEILVLRRGEQVGLSEALPAQGVSQDGRGNAYALPEAPS